MKTSRTGRAAGWNKSFLFNQTKWSGSKYFYQTFGESYQTTSNMYEYLKYPTKCCILYDWLNDYSEMVINFI
jgi:hypothetical protein